MEKIKSTIELRYDAYEANILQHQRHEKPAPTVIQLFVEIILCLILLPVLIPVCIVAVFSAMFLMERGDAL